MNVVGVVIVIGDRPGRDLEIERSCGVIVDNDGTRSIEIVARVRPGVVIGEVHNHAGVGVGGIDNVLREHERACGNERELDLDNSRAIDRGVAA